MKGKESQTVIDKSTVSCLLYIVEYMLSSWDVSSATSRLWKWRGPRFVAVGLDSPVPSDKHTRVTSRAETSD